MTPLRGLNASIKALLLLTKRSQGFNYNCSNSANFPTWTSTTLVVTKWMDQSQRLNRSWETSCNRGWINLWWTRRLRRGHERNKCGRMSWSNVDKVFDPCPRLFFGSCILLFSLCFWCFLVDSLSKVENNVVSPIFVCYQCFCFMFKSCFFGCAALREGKMAQNCIVFTCHGLICGWRPSGMKR